MVVMSGKRIKQVCHLVATAGVCIGIAVHEKYFLPMHLAHIRINSAQRLAWVFPEKIAMQQYTFSIHTYKGPPYGLGWRHWNDIVKNYSPNWLFIKEK